VECIRVFILFVVFGGEIFCLYLRGVRRNMMLQMLSIYCIALIKRMLMRYTILW